MFSLVLTTAMLIAACGGGDSEPTAAPVASPTSISEPVATSAPAPTQLPAVQPDATATTVPQVEPTNVPAQTATPLPTLTPTPVVSNIFEGYGFSFQLDQDSTFASSDLVINGWTGDAADNDQGLMTFTYNGADVVLFWEPQAANTPQSLTAETYQLLTLGRPDFEFTALNEGDLTVDGQAGTFAGFVFADSAGENASGGLIGAWSCPGTGAMMSLTATSSDATALQIRFDRLVSGFECGS